MSVSEDERLPPELDRILELPPGLRRNLYFVGVLSRYLPPGPPPIVVGGQALELYTLGQYATQDVDLVYGRRGELDRLLLSWGFERSGRHWTHNDWQIALEAPDETLAGDEERVTILDIEGLEVRVIGYEDLLIDRLNAAVHWDSEEDRQWSARLAANHEGRLDWEYLRRRAEEEGLTELLDEIQRGTAGDSPH